MAFFKQFKTTRLETLPVLSSHAVLFLSVNEIIKYIVYCKLGHSFWVVTQFSQDTWFLILMLLRSNSYGTSLFILLLQTILHTKNTFNKSQCSKDAYLLIKSAFFLPLVLTPLLCSHSFSSTTFKDCKDVSSMESAIRCYYINTIKVEVNTRIFKKLCLNTKYDPS